MGRTSLPRHEAPDFGGAIHLGKSWVEESANVLEPFQRVREREVTVNAFGIIIS